MAKAKTIYVEAYNADGDYVTGDTVTGKKNRHPALVDAIRSIRATGGVIREQECGAPAWRTWYLQAGAKWAEAGHPVNDDWTPYSKGE